MLRLEAEGAGHAAAAGVEDLEVKAELLENRLLVGSFQDGLVVAVGVDQGLAPQPGRPIVFYFLVEELAQHERLLAQALGVLVAGKQAQQLVAKDGYAARLQPDDRDASLDPWLQRLEDLAQQAFGG